MASSASSPAKAQPATPSGRRLQTRRSGVHGKGVFAVQDLGEGETLIEYIGEVITWKEALRRHPHDPANPNHTFYFHIDDKHVIDGKYHGNSARWINHSCNPNCEADEVGGRVFVKALRNIKAGDELFYDYGLIIDTPYTPKLLSEYPCWCGNKNCRGTLLAPKEKKDSKKALKKAEKQEEKEEKAARKVAEAAAGVSSGLKADLKAAKKAGKKAAKKADKPELKKAGKKDADDKKKSKKKKD